MVAHIEGGKYAEIVENRVLRRTFGPRREELTKEWRMLHNEELDNLYTSPNIFRVNKSIRMRWAGCNTNGGETRFIHGFRGET